MKLLIFSDSHGRSEEMRRGIRKERDADAILFLGDGWRDADDIHEEFPDIAFYRVRGNCDVSFRNDPLSDLLSLGGSRIFFCHGHSYGVKYGEESLIAAARVSGADVALFGHTHEAVVRVLAPSDKEKGKPLLLVNPGSVGAFPSSYAVLFLTDGEPPRAELRQHF